MRIHWLCILALLCGSLPAHAKPFDQKDAQRAIDTHKNKIPPPDSSQQKKPARSWTDLQLNFMQRNGPDAAQETGCWKSDSPPLDWMKVPSGKMLTVGGWLYYKDGWEIKVFKDQCVPNDPTSILEGYCKSTTKKDGKVELKAVINKMIACPVGTQCGGAGLAAGCITPKAPPVATSPSNGCLVGQLPFLDSNADGKADVCVCPSGTVGIDTNNDLNADTCAKLKPGSKAPPCEQLLSGDWGKFDWDGDGVPNNTDADDDDDGIPDAQDTDGFSADAVKGVMGGANGGNLYDFCENPFTLRHVFCSVDALQTSSLTQCSGTEVCEFGNCIPSESAICKPVNVQPDSTIQGYVNIIPTDAPPFDVPDTCYTDQEDPPHGYVAKVHCQGAKGGWEFDAILCPAGYSCQWNDPNQKTSGICKPKALDQSDPDWDDDGIPNSKDPDTDNDGKPNAQDPDDNGDGVPDDDWDNDGIPNDKDPDTDFDGDGKPNDQDDDDDGDGTPDKNDDKPCIPKTEPTCSEPNDAEHPKDPATGITLYGNPAIFGETEVGIEIIDACGLPPIDPPPVSSPDDCKWDETKLLPELVQYGCSGVSLQSSQAPCDWAQGLACDWQAETAAQKGICQQKKQNAQVTCTPATEQTPGTCTGSNAFGHAVNHSDSCLPKKGPKLIKRWQKPKVAGSSVEGVVAVIESCPNQHYCEGGICLPEPCFNKKYDDQNPCTEDSCESVSGGPLYLPVPINDDNYCTIDSCVDDNGTAKFLHVEITTGNCAGWTYCKDPANKEKPECTDATPTVDCAKEPSNPACPQPGVDCQKTPEDPACQPKVDCAKDPDNPACPQAPGIDCQKTPELPECKPAVDCAKEPTNPACPPPPGQGIDCQATPELPECQPTIDCTQEEFQDNPACPPTEPTGGFSCAPCVDTAYSKEHPECAQCVQTNDYCFDDDYPSQINLKGKAVIFPGLKGQEQMGHDICVDYDLNTKQYTAVLQADCGPNLTFFYSKSSCPPSTEGCVDGTCGAK